MMRNTRFRWQISLAGAALAAAVVIGGALAWADPPAAPAPAAAPAAGPNHDAAIAAFTKARDLYEKKQYAQAEAENDQALKLEPGLEDAVLLKRIIEEKMAESAGTSTPSSPGAAGPAVPGKARFLSAADIRLIKVNEWQPKADANLRGTIDRKTLETFWNDVMRKQTDAASMSKEAHDAFVAQSNFSNQVREIQRSGDPKYMEKVVFNSAPQSLLVFKRTVEPYVLQNCATAACHAGDKAGNFKLFRPANGANDDQTLYTNFYILAMYANADGKMIDRDHPDTSLLLQYGMIKSKAVKPHPGKVEVRFFADSTDPRFAPMVDWIKNLAFPRPDYGILYELPGSAPAAQPASTTQPAAKPAK